MIIFGRERENLIIFVSFPTPYHRHISLSLSLFFRFLIFLCKWFDKKWVPETLKLFDYYWRRERIWWFFLSFPTLNQRHISLSSFDFWYFLCKWFDKKCVPETLKLFDYFWNREWENFDYFRAVSDPLSPAHSLFLFSSFISSLNFFVNGSIKMVSSFPLSRNPKIVLRQFIRLR